MKKFKKTIVVFSLALISLFILSQLKVNITFRDNCFVSKALCAGSEALKVYLDGKETGIVCQGEKDKYILPLSIPFKEGENKWEIIINYDKTGKKVDVIRKFHSEGELLKTRGEDGKVTCVWCNGTGKCQYCSPPGSGNSSYTQGEKCTVCGGSGVCSTCSGSGKQ